MTQSKDIIDDAIAIAMHSMQTMFATTLVRTPGALAFSRDMFLNILILANQKTIYCKREHHVNENLCKANDKRLSFDYAEGQQVMKKVHNLTNLGVRTTGTYTIQHVHVNGNLTIELCPGLLQ